MLWGCFGLNGGRLATVSGRMTSADYTELLEINLLPFGEELGGPRWVFQQDNAPIHDSEYTHQWMQGEGIQVLPWPACSPDLNPIENIWGMLVRKVYQGGRQFDTVKQLEAAIYRAWADLDVQYMQKLIDGMRRRLVKVIKKEGAQIGY